jgi:hypothetical protein
MGILPDVFECLVEGWRIGWTGVCAAVKLGRVFLPPRICGGTGTIRTGPRGKDSLGGWSV